MAHLYERLYEPFRRMVRTSVPDGESGTRGAWAEGEEIPAVARFTESVETRTGAAAGVSSRYKITVPRSVPLQYHEVLKRVSDGKIFRVTSDGDDVIPPTVATFTFCQVTAEEWEVTTDDE